MSHNNVLSNSSNASQNTLKKENVNKVKEEDFLNIFDFSTTQNDTEEKSADKPINNHKLDYLSYLTNNNDNAIPTQQYNTNENFNDLNKLLTNTVGNSEYLDIPFPMVFSNNDDYKQNNIDFDDSGSLMSYTTNNTYTSNKTANGRRKYSKGINPGVAGSVKSYRSYTAESIDDQMAKERKKQIHNNVEKNRRELIKKKIKELSEIIPISVMKRVAANALNEGLDSSTSKVYTPDTIDVRKIKYRKRDVLCGSVIYINLLREVVDGVNKKSDMYSVLINRLKDRLTNSSSHMPRADEATAEKGVRRFKFDETFDGNIEEKKDEFAELLQSLGNSDSTGQHPALKLENTNNGLDFSNVLNNDINKSNNQTFDSMLNLNDVGYDDVFKNMMTYVNSDKVSGLSSASALTNAEENHNQNTNGNQDDVFSAWLDLS